MSKVSVIAKLSAQPGKRDALAAGLQSLIDHVESEPGTLMYVLHDDLKDENVLWFYEMYTDQAALDAHSTSDTMKALGGQVGGFLAALPEMFVIAPRGGKGL